MKSKGISYSQKELILKMFDFAISTVDIQVLNFIRLLFVSYKLQVSILERLCCFYHFNPQVEIWIIIVFCHQMQRNLDHLLREGTVFHKMNVPRLCRQSLQKKEALVGSSNSRNTKSSSTWENQRDKNPHPKRIPG